VSNYCFNIVNHFDTNVNFKEPPSFVNFESYKLNCEIKCNDNNNSWSYLEFIDDISKNTNI
jgi:hypothetical protein